MWSTHRFGQLAGLLWWVENFVKEDREVEGQAQPNGVGGLHLRLGDVISILVSLLGVLNDGWKVQISSKKPDLTCISDPRSSSVITLNWQKEKKHEKHKVAKIS